MTTTPDQPFSLGQRTLYVNAYLVDQCYGGLEEGGWYYEVGEAIGSVPVTVEALPLDHQYVSAEDATCDTCGCEPHRHWYWIGHPGNDATLSEVKHRLLAVLDPDYDESIKTSNSRCRTRGGYPLVRVQVEHSFAADWNNYRPYE